MKRTFTWIFGIIGGLVILIILTGMLMPMIYDTDDIKRTITRKVQVETGRDLQFGGELTISVFPWLAVELNDVSLSNAPGFGDQPFARVANARIGVALMPLLRQELVVDEVVLDSLELNLAVNGTGESNWDDLTGAGDNGTRTKGKGSDFTKQRIAGLSITEASLTYLDEQSGDNYQLTGLSVTTGPLGDAGPVSLEVSMRLEDVSSGQRLDVTASSSAAMDQEAQSIELTDLRMSLQDPDGSLPEAQLTAPLLAADLDAGEISIDTFQLSLAELTAHGQLHLSDFSNEPAYDGSLQIEEFSPAGLLQELGQEAPVTTDPDALGSASLNASFAGGLDSIMIRPLELRLDQTQMSGQVEVWNIAESAIRFDLAVDSIDLDRYLEPASGDADSPPGAEGGATAIPHDELAGLDMEGSLRIGALRVTGLDLTNAEIGLRLRNRNLRLMPLTADFYGGRYNGLIRLDARGDIPVISINEKVESIVFQQLAGDLLGSDKISGTAIGKLKATGQGHDTDQLLATLSGNLDLSLSEGALEGIDVWYEMRKAMAGISGKSPPAEGSQGRTVFSKMKLQATIIEGMLTTNELTGELPFMAINGNGTIDLREQLIDMGLDATVRNSPEISRDPVGSTLQGRTIPLTLSGPLTAPVWGFDVEAVLKDEATQMLLDKVLGSSSGDSEEKSGSDRNKESALGLISGFLKANDNAKDEAKDENDDGDD